MFNMAKDANNASSVRTVTVPCIGTVFTVKSAIAVRFRPSSVQFHVSLVKERQTPPKPAGCCHLSPILSTTSMIVITYPSRGNSQIKTALPTTSCPKNAVHANLITPIMRNILAIYRLNINLLADFNNLHG